MFDIGKHPCLASARAQDGTTIPAMFAKPGLSDADLRRIAAANGFDLRLKAFEEDDLPLDPMEHDVAEVIAALGLPAEDRDGYVKVGAWETAGGAVNVAYVKLAGAAPQAAAARAPEAEDEDENWGDDAPARPAPNSLPRVPSAEAPPPAPAAPTGLAATLAKDEPEWPDRAVLVQLQAYTADFVAGGAVHEDWNRVWLLLAWFVSVPTSFIVFLYFFLRAHL